MSYGGRLERFAKFLREEMLPRIQCQNRKLKSILFRLSAMESEKMRCMGIRMRQRLKNLR